MAAPLSTAEEQKAALAYPLSDLTPYFFDKQWASRCLRMHF